MRFECPHCLQQSISLKQKYLAGKWAIVYCPQCGERSCANPYILGLLSTLYVWDVLLFGYLAFVKYQFNQPAMSAVYLAIMVGAWLVLDFFSIYVPLSAMRPRSPRLG